MRDADLTLEKALKLALLHEKPNLVKKTLKIIINMQLIYTTKDIISKMSRLITSPSLVQIKVVEENAYFVTCGTSFGCFTFKRLTFDIHSAVKFSRRKLPQLIYQDEHTHKMTLWCGEQLNKSVIFASQTYTGMHLS